MESGVLNAKNTVSTSLLKSSSPVVVISIVGKLKQEYLIELFL